MLSQVSRIGIAIIVFTGSLVSILYIADTSITASVGSQFRAMERIEKAATRESEKQKQMKLPRGWRIYSDKERDIQFYHPAMWGSVIHHPEHEVTERKQWFTFSGLLQKSQRNLHASPFVDILFLEYGDNVMTETVCLTDNCAQTVEYDLEMQMQEIKEHADMTIGSYPVIETITDDPLTKSTIYSYRFFTGTHRIDIHAGQDKKGGKRFFQDVQKFIKSWTTRQSES